MARVGLKYLVHQKEHKLVITYIFTFLLFALIYYIRIIMIIIIVTKLYSFNYVKTRVVGYFKMGPMPPGFAKGGEQCAFSSNYRCIVCMIA